MRRVGILLLVCALACAFAPFAAATSTGIPNSQRLAVLASNMIAIAADREYRLECGPKDDMLPTAPTAATNAGSDYCVMRVGTGASAFLIYGSYGDSPDAAKNLLATYKDDRYNNQLKVGEVDTGACDGLDFSSGTQEYQVCDNALARLHTYYYDDFGNGVGYLLVSENSLTSTGFIDTILDFFGLGGKKVPFITTTDQFHHAYFASVGTGGQMRNVTATWFDNDAVLKFQNFVTDFNKTKPDDARYYTGHGKTQVIRMSLNPNTAADKLLWREYTSRLRIDSTTPGTPLAGDVCGDGNPGFDEQCEPGGDVKSCAWYAKTILGTPSAFSSGNLKCFPKDDSQGRGCSWDTSACIACVDADNDKFFGGQGISGGSLSVLPSFQFGTIAPYGAFEDDTNTLEAARTSALNITGEVYPVAYDLVFPPGSTANFTFDTAVRANTGYSKTGFATAKAAAINNIIKNQAKARPCALSGTTVVCPDGFSPGALGIPKNGTVLLEELKARNVAPIIRITLGTCGDGTCGIFAHDTAAGVPWTARSGLPTKNSYTPDDLSRIEAYCGVVADAVGTYWSSSHTQSVAFPSTFIVIGDPKQAGMSATTYDAVYTRCRKGIKTALGQGTVVLYGAPPTNDNDFPTYAAKLASDTVNYDGLYIEPRISGGQYEEFASVENYRTATASLGTINQTKFERATIAPVKGNLFGTLLIIEHASLGVNLLYDTLGTRNFSIITSGDTPAENITNVTRFWTAASHGFLGTVYEFKSLPGTTQALPPGVKAYFAQTAPAHSTITIFNFNSEAAKFPIDLSKCSAEKVTNLTDKDEKSSVSSGSTAAKYANNTTAYSITTIELKAGVSCITGTGGLANCGGAIDCMDKDPVPPMNDAYGNPVLASSVYPGAPEQCGSGVDYNCDGNTPTAPPGCTVGPVTPPTGITCNYNGHCDADETSACWDCAQATLTCPTPVTLNQTRGAYNISTRTNPYGVPELLITLYGTVKYDPGNYNPYVMYGGTKCYLSGDGGYPVILVAFNTTSDPATIAWTTEHSSTGIVTMNRETTTTGGQWRLKTQSGSAFINKCFATDPTKNDGDTFDLVIPFNRAPPCMEGRGPFCDDPVWPGGDIGADCAFRRDCCNGLVCRGGVCDERTNPYCFVAGTPVKTPTGDVSIEQLQLGDPVIAYDTDAQREIVSPVTFVEHNLATGVVLLQPEGLPLITTTAVHRFWTERGWVPAGELTTDDTLKTRTGWVGIKSIAEKQVPPTDVYNIHIKDDAHDFYAGGVLVHNVKADYQIP